MIFVCILLALMLVQLLNSINETVNIDGEKGIIIYAWINEILEHVTNILIVALILCCIFSL